MTRCSICGSTKDVVRFKEGNICKSCIAAIKAQTKEITAEKTYEY